jgi:hypothetical protein
MRNAIALITAVLGVVLVLVGAAALWGAGLRRSGGQETVRTETPTKLERGLVVAGQLPGGERLIGWGVALLALAAVASGAISFAASATAGTD